jgi:hypothetical protein
MFTYSIVYQGIKKYDESIKRNLEVSFEIAKYFPELEIGYDMVDNEDRYAT